MDYVAKGLVGTRLTAELALFVARLRPADLSPSVLARAQALVLDLVGNIVCARHDCESTAPLVAAIRAMGLGAGTSTVFGDTDGYTPAGAALMNGALGHSLDFDDTHAEAALHPGCTVIPAAFAASELRPVSGPELLAGIVAGYDVACRLALALPSAEHYASGYQPTATCGAFGAAAAAAKVLGLDAENIESAFGIVLSQAAGSPQFAINGAWTKRFQVGWAAMSGLSAACLAREGFVGAAEAIEGRHGFLQRAASPDVRRILSGLGDEFELMRTGVKPYPSCRFGHAGIDAALAFREQTGIVDPDRIEQVVFGTSALGLSVIGAPLDKRRKPQTIVDGQFSAPFVIAVALLTGKMDWASYALLRDPAVQKMMDRITCKIDEEAESAFPAQMAGSLEVITDGRHWQRMIRSLKGEPDHFLSDEELRSKFTGLTVPALGISGAERLAEAVMDLACAQDLTAVTKLGKASSAGTHSLASCS